MKKIDITTSIILVFVDFTLLVLAGVSSYASRYQGWITRFRPVFFDYPFHDFFPLVIIASIIGIIIFAISGLYRMSGNFKVTDIISRVFLAVSTNILLIIVIIFFQREAFSSRFVIIFAWILAVVYISAGRLIVNKIKTLFLRRGYGSHYVIILGKQAALDLKRYFSSAPHLGVKIAHIYDELNESTKQSLHTMITTTHIDEIIDTTHQINDPLRTELIQLCNENGIEFSYLASSYQTRNLNFEADSIAGYPIIHLKKTPLDGWGRIYKRLSDSMSALLLLILLSPLFVVIAASIKFDSKGKTFVALQRVGLHGKIFTLYKFRSMIKDAHMMKTSIQQLNERADGPLFKISNDPRITRVGRFLRKTSLDELPQLYNVLRGDMSMVGPRPHEPEEVEKYDRAYTILMSIRPGLSGLSQVSGRSNLMFQEEVNLDVFYIENWSIALDIQIVLKTFIVLFKFKDAA